MSKIHSVKLPSQYRTAIKIVRKVIVEKQSYKTLLFNEKHARINRLNALLDSVFRNRTLIESIIEKSEIIINEPKLDHFTCLVLVTELLIGHATALKGESKPIQTVLANKSKLQELFNELDQSTVQKNTEPLPRYVRVNLLKISFAEALNECNREGFQNLTKEYETYAKYLEAVRNLTEYDFLLDFHIPNLLVFSPKTRSYWAGSELVLEDKFILQDKASCLPPILLEPKKRSVVLDMCAAPGMKTSQIAAILKNKGKIYANDFDESRFHSLSINLKKKNVKCATPINRDALELTGEEFPDVEYILIDPSCSGSGMVSHRGDIEKNEFRIRKLARLQTKLLVHTLQSFPNAKRVVYSTCSIYPEENEQVVEKAVARCPNFKLMNAKQLVGDSWINFGSRKYKNVGKRCLYMLEKTDLTNGFFCAVFENRNLENASVGDLTTLMESNENNGGNLPEDVQDENQIDPPAKKFKNY